MTMAEISISQSNFSHEKISQAEAWLYEHASKPEQIELGLERCHKLLSRLGLSQPPYKIITVAGTNGKGSTVGYLDVLLQSENYSTGRYTSPHLFSFNERIAVDGVDCNDQEIISAFDKIQFAAGKIKLTYFEYSTIAALLIFAERKVDVAVLEVGLGGRLDATNSVDADVAVITSISLDHENWLGNTLNQVGWRKIICLRA